MQDLSLLLHICCARCATYTLKRLQERGFQVTGFWYNPNIHPYFEHENRRQSLVEYAQGLSLPMIFWEDYEMPQFLRRVAGREAERHRLCYEMRLARTAQVAAERSFPRFTTTLLLSLYQDQELIRAIGEKMAAQYGPEFYYEDFRQGWQEHYEMSQKAGLYRQKYCGCIYSEWERYAKRDVADLVKETERGGER